MPTNIRILNLNLMKKYIALLLLIMVGVGIAIPVDAQSRKQKKEAFKQQIIKRVQARRFRVNITEAAGNHGTSGITEGSVAIDDSVVISSLPYYGKLQTSTLDPSNVGLNFESPTTDYLSSILYDGTAKILFNAKRELENFVFYIVISPNGKATVSVHSDRRTPATYTGEFEYK